MLKFCTPQGKRRDYMVNPGSKAALKGVREGDVITSINDQPTRDITNADAHVLLKKSGDTLKLGLNEDCGGSPKRRQYSKTAQQEVHSESVERTSTSKTIYSSTTSLTIKRSQPDTERLEKTDDFANDIISQKSTLSSSSGSNAAGPSTSTESQGKTENKWLTIPRHYTPEASLNLPLTQKPSLDVSDNKDQQPTELKRSFFKENVEHMPNNRLLEIIRESKKDKLPVEETKTTQTTSENLEATNLSQWLQLVRGKSISTPHLDQTREFSSTNKLATTDYQDKAVNVHVQEQNRGRSISTRERRFSLPQEAYQREIDKICEQEEELQHKIERLELERLKVISEMTAKDPFKQYRVSKKDDLALHYSTDARAPMAPTEFFRQKMYNEYMEKVAARQERKMQKVIKITSTRTSEVEESAEAAHVNGIEDEFMDKVKERMKKHGLKQVSGENIGQENVPSKSGEKEHIVPIMVMDGNSLKEVKALPKHLQEFVDITRRAENDTEDGVWSPGQKSYEETPKASETQEAKKKDDPIPPVWTPRSAGSSPTLERKEFRPVNFESPVLGRKNKLKIEDPVTSQTHSIQQPWTSDSNPGKVITSVTLERRLPTSYSAPASGFADFSITRLPRAQNPTITLLQKAREGQLPRGAAYIQPESFYSYRNQSDKSVLEPGEVSYHHRNEYANVSNTEKPKKISNSDHTKYEVGIGPTTIDGMPLVLRSEIKDSNQSKWYKRMYDTIHKQKPDRDYVTVRYKQRRARYPYASGYFSEPEHTAFSADYYDSDGTVSDSKYATLDRRRQIQPNKDKENGHMSSIVNIDKEYSRSGVIKHEQEMYKKQPGRIENYLPGRSSISEKEAKEWWDEVMDIFDGHLEQQRKAHQPRSYMSQALKESGYESDSTLIFRRREDAIQQLSPSEQREAYKSIQKGGDVPLHGLRKPAPERPKEADAPTPPPKGPHGIGFFETGEINLHGYAEPLDLATPVNFASKNESPRKYVENEVTIHYKTPVRQEIKESLSEEELSRRQAEHMKRVYEEERRRKYLQELQDMNSRRHTDNFTPSQKSPIPLNRYDDFPSEESPKIKPRPRSPEPRLVARALYNFVGQSVRELTFRKGDVIYVRRQVDKNWYEGEHNAMIGLFPANYVEIIPYDGLKSTPRKSHEGQARAKFNFIAQTHLELSLAKGELVVITRRVDDNWFEGRIGGRKGIFPVSYVEVLIDPAAPPPPTPVSEKPVAAPAAHSMLVNGSAGGKESMGSHSYIPSIPSQQQFTSSYRAKPAQVNNAGNYGSLSKSAGSLKNPLNEVLHIDTHSEPVPYRALYKYRPQNDDELELFEGDVVYVLEKCDDGWYVGSSQRTGAFGTFPGNYVERI